MASMGYYQATDAAMTLPGLNRAPKEMNAKGFDLLCKFFAGSILLLPVVQFITIVGLR